ncbi:MAG: TetR/AcrR family transcriptional regulator [Anaerolineales bacterium]|jgi:AcrR family transcriptional regulator
MTRIVKEYAVRREEILDAAQRLIYTKGYEKLTIRDILEALQISNGAFYHYFDSKPALLEAIIERGQDELDKVFLGIVDDPNLFALDKFRRFFATLDHARIAQQAFIADLMRVWFADDNAIVREKTDEVFVQRRVPLLNAIVRQGIQEGVFTTPYPDQAGQIILSITRGMGNAVLKLVIAFEQDREQLHFIEDVVATNAASAEAIERVLGASSACVYRPTAEDVKAWLAPPQNKA